MENLKKLFLISDFVGPKIIIIFYWSMLVIAFVIGYKVFEIGVLNHHINQQNLKWGRRADNITFIWYIAGIFTFFFTAIMARLFAELMLVLFRINDNLSILRKNSANQIK